MAFLDLLPFFNAFDNVVALFRPNIRSSRFDKPSNNHRIVTTTTTTTTTITVIRFQQHGQRSYPSEIAVRMELWRLNIPFHAY